MNGRIVRRLTQIFFLLLTVLLLLYFDAVLCIRSEHGTDQTRALYHQPGNTIDAVMMGTSHIHYDIDPALLWEHYGIAAYDYSAAEQPLWLTWYYLQEFCRYQTPRIVVLDLFGPAHFRDDYQYDFILENLNGIRFSLNKLRMVSVSIERDRIEDFYPSFATYHGRALSLTGEDYLFPFVAGKEFRTFKGYKPYLDATPQERPRLDSSEKNPFTRKSQQYLTKIVDYTQAHDMSLILLVTPYADVDWDKPAHNWLGDYARDHDLVYVDGNYAYDEIGLDFAQDFYDDSHLNHWGAQKFTAWLGDILHTQYDLPDRRGDDRYDSWWDNVESIDAYVRENS